MASNAVSNKSVKQPEDRKPKVVKPKVEEVDGAKLVTLHDVQWRIDDDAMNDFELMDELREVDRSQDASAFPSMLRRLLGQDQYRRVLDVLRNPETGRVPADKGIEFVQHVFEALNPNS